jgi:protease IV
VPQLRSLERLQLSDLELASRIGGVRGAARRGVGRCNGAARLRAAARARPAIPGAALLAVALASAGCITLDLPFGGPAALEERLVQGESGPKILLLDVDGVLSEEGEAGTLGFGGRENPVARIREQLDLARRDSEMRAVLLRIQSPGGTVTASDVIYREVLRFKEETKLPIVAHCLGVCASGGYYVALAADRILAHPTTVTGSIGVIFSGLSLAGLLERYGVEDQTLKSGDFKDAGSPWRRMTPGERAQLQSVIDDLQSRFLEVLRAGRPGLDAAAAARLADGRIFSARQARAAGLVDEVGYLGDSVAELERRAGLSESRVVAYRRPREWSENLYSRSETPLPRAGLAGTDPLAALLPAPGFLYLWWPGGAAP